VIRFDTPESGQGRLLTAVPDPSPGSPGLSCRVVLQGWRSATALICLVGAESVPPSFIPSPVTPIFISVEIGG
jgi:hypothetical protein